VTKLRFLVVYFAAWIPAAALYSFMILRMSGPRERSSVANAVWGGVESMAVAALLGLIVWASTRRLAERPRPVPSLVVAHIGLSLAYTTVWSAWILLSIYLFAPRSVYEQYVQFGLGWQFLTGFFVYGMVAGIAHALTVTRRLRRERDATLKAEALRTHAELSALRAQMNPHFLFNTLHSIAALARTDPAAVEDALERLAGLLRRLLDVRRLSADQVPLSDEWDIVRDQLELEKLRFGNRLRVVTDIDNDALECMIPIFTLQPLVENAVKHGVAARTEPCTIWISAHVSGLPKRDSRFAGTRRQPKPEVLEVEVRDDGPGADKRAASNGEGLGLRSVRQRLLAIHGDHSGVHVETEPGKGFVIRVTMPAVAPAVAGTAPVASAAR
jgi:signal transduction histidine kinase